LKGPEDDWADSEIDALATGWSVSPERRLKIVPAAMDGPDGGPVGLVGVDDDPPHPTSDSAAKAIHRCQARAGTRFMA